MTHEAQECLGCRLGCINAAARHIRSHCVPSHRMPRGFVCKRVAVRWHRMRAHACAQAHARTCMRTQPTVERARQDSLRLQLPLHCQSGQRVLTRATKLLPKLRRKSATKALTKHSPASRRRPRGCASYRLPMNSVHACANDALSHLRGHGSKGALEHRHSASRLSKSDHK